MTPSDSVPSRPKHTGIRNFVKHHGSTLVGQSLYIGLGALAGILSARLLGPVGRGELQAITLWPTVIAYLLCLGISQAIAFNVGRRAFTVSEIMTASAALGVMQSILAIVVGLVVVHFALAKYSPHVRYLGAIFVLFTPAYLLGGYPQGLAQGLQSLRIFNLIRVAGPLAYFAGLVALLFLNRGSLDLVVAAQAVSWLVGLAVGLGWVWRVVQPRVRWNATAIPRMIGYGYKTQATGLATYFNQRIDQLILVLLVPPRQVGLYVVAVTLSTAVTVFPQAAGIVTFSRGANQSSEDAKATIGNSFRASLIWLLVTCGAIYVLAPFLIHLVVGPAFDGSILACRILLPGALMIGLNQVLYNGAYALGRPGLPSFAEGMSMAVTAVGLYLLVPHYGYVGAAAVSTVAYTVSFLVMLGLANRKLGIGLGVLFLGRRRPAEAETPSV